MLVNKLLFKKYFWFRNFFVQKYVWSKKCFGRNTFGKKKNLFRNFCLHTKFQLPTMLAKTFRVALEPNWWVGRLRSLCGGEMLGIRLKRSPA